MSSCRSACVEITYISNICLLSIDRCYTACIAAGGTLGGTAVVVGVPAAIAGIGFTAGGVAAGSTAASMMAAKGSVAAGRVYCCSQAVRTAYVVSKCMQ